MLDLYQAWGAGFISDVNVSHTLARPHITMSCVLAHAEAAPHRSTCLSLHARGNFASRASTLPYGSVRSYAGADPHTLNPLLLHAQWFILLMLLPIRTREARRIEPGSAGLSSFFPYAGACAA